MKSRLPTQLATFAAVAGALAYAESATAQVDINPPLPNVMLLVDTSGSMELMTDGNTTEVEAPCVPGTPTAPNRWASLVAALTGTVSNFSCSALDRTTTPFRNEYMLSGADPYDYKYYMPFHRILSNGCAPGPGVLPANWGDWPNGAIKYHQWSDPNVICPAPGAPGGFSQLNDGILDTFRGRVRFGLMTFDSFPDPSVGASGQLADYGNGLKGMWSYYLGWNGAGSPKQGNPANCAISSFEVGGRSPAAPPWEGRLLGFGAYDAPTTDVIAAGDRVQEAIVAMRPYGATPIAGMLDDARSFLWSDTTSDPSGKPYGPAQDPYVTGGCRKNFIILLSDGAPNLDLRTSCEAAGAPNGSCPYQKPYEVARDLATAADPAKRIKTYVVGFAMSQVGNVNCKTLTQADLTDAAGLCSNASGALKACCTLGRIAYEGGTSGAYFADNVSDLKTALSQVLASIAGGSTSRTMPVFATAGSVTSKAPAASYRFASSFIAPGGASLWNGNLERKRTSCGLVNGSYQATAQNIDASLGDDFAANLNTGVATRKIFTVLGTASGSGVVYSLRSIRPSLALDDGLGIYGGTLSAGGPTDPTTFSSTMGTNSMAMAIDPAALPTDCGARILAANASLCASRVINWEVGISNAPILAESRNPASCPVGQTCSMLGAIYHATPAVVTPPRDYLRDESYSGFALLQAKRPTVLYSATTDGQLHAFKVSRNDPVDAAAVDALAQNELWSFIPPNVLPRMLPTYNQQAIRLDGSPVVKDVVFERTQDQSKAGTGTWSTVVLGGGGAGGGFYYALDVTNPLTPKFLWQLSTDTAGNSLFGSTTPTPAIATIPVIIAGAIKEVAVAILPGGSAALAGGTCNRQTQLWPNVDANFKPRTAVRAWGQGCGAVGAGRSLTIVRLDTGETLMTFRGAAGDGPPGVIAAKVKVSPFDSPITGVPVPYPAGVGQAATRVYVGDADGTMWRIDLSNPDPTQWSASLAWDAYSVAGDTASIGQPIQNPPVVAVDSIGNNVVLFSTGDQDQINSGGSNRVWSFNDKPSGASFATTANWNLQFTNGKRVTGPISLFNTVAYFATYTPSAPGALACTDGYGSLWGVDYMRVSGAYTPAARLVPDPNQPLVIVSYQDQPLGTVVFGVAVAQTPSCSSDPSSSSDPYLGSHTTIGGASAASYQLVFQTGQKGGNQVDQSKTKANVQTLPAPRMTTRLDSWASVLE